MRDYHEEFRERTVAALKEACDTLKNNAEAIVGSVDQDLGRSGTTITITLPSMNDNSYTIPDIEVSQIFISRRVAERLYGETEKRGDRL